MNNQTIARRLADMRHFMEDKKLHAFIVPTTDAHLSEYPVSHWSAREWLSGFTGSAGTLVVTRERVGLWTDSRYFLQAAQELKGTEIELFRDGLSTTPSLENWIISQLGENDYVGIDANVYGAKDALSLTHKMNQHGLHIISDYDPFDTIWKDRPSIPQNPIFVLPEKYTGEPAKDKISKTCDAIEFLGAQSLLIASLDTIAWLFNIRGNDVKCNPVAVSYAYVSRKETILFIDPKKLSIEIVDYLKSQNIIVAEYNKVFDYTARLDQETICLDGNRISYKLYNAIASSCKVIDTQSPVDLMKSIKNETEIQGFRDAMQRDGVALVQFLMWLEKAVPKGNVYEIDIPKKLVEYRSQQINFVGESFDTISGYATNAAIVHYHVSPDTSIKIEPKGFLLIDSGAQYFDGTTDITRTIALGELSEQMKKDYTMVLKGHIGIATAIYPEGTRGSQIDILARKTLWDNGLNYLHGTGHGIGHFLNVHEGPQSIRMNENPIALQIGMVTSNEPGLYRANQYGIRIENLVLTRKEMDTEFGTFHSFETLTLCPIDTTPIVKEMLTEQEITWFNLYHKYVYDRLSPLLLDDEKTWLKEKTKDI